MQVIDANGNMFGYDSITIAGPDGKPKTLSSAIKLTTLVRNTSGSTMTKGTVVYINGGSGNKPTIAKALATSDATSAQTYGVVQSNIANNKNGYVVVVGTLEGLDTSAYAPGTQLYLSSTTAGTWTSIKQLAPAHLVYVGIVVRQHVNHGIVEVKIQNGYELDELHDVSITTPLNNQVLQYESATSLWKNKTISTGITIGSTAIASGVVGRVLFEGAGNVVQESSQLTWNNSTNALQVTTGKTLSGYNSGGSASDALKLELTGGGAVLGIQNSNATGFSGIEYLSNTGAPRVFTGFNNSNGQEFRFNNFATGGYIDFLIGGTSGLRIANTRNILIGTTTDAGFKLDVNGTARVQSTLSISNPSFTMGGSITHSANATLVITGGPGAGSENITFGPSNRIFINAQQSRFPSGSVQVGGTLTVGNSGFASSTNMLYVTGGITASSAIARGQFIDNTLTASANNDVLVGLDIAPTFTNGSFTGLTNIGLRLTQSANINNNFRMQSASGYANIISFWNLNGNTGQGALVATNTTFGYGTYVGNQVNLSGGTGGVALRTSNSAPIRFYATNADPDFSTIQMQMFGATGNVVLQNGGTYTDAGFKLDVNGTARVQGLTTIRTLASSYNNPLVVENTGSAAVDNKNVAIFQGNRGNASNIDDNTNIGIQQKNNTVNNYAAFNFFNAGFNLSAYVAAQFLNHGSGQNGNLIFGTTLSGTPATRMTIFSTGNVGINTTTDAGFKLDVNGTAIFRSVLEIQNTNGLRLRSSGAGASISLRPSANLLELRTNDASILSATFNQNGVVGFSQQVGFGSTAVSNASALVEMTSTTQGFLPPRMTTTQKNAIATPATGLQVYDTTLNRPCFYDGSTWITL